MTKTWKAWTDEEVAAFRKNYRPNDYGLLRAAFPRRNMHSLYNMARELGLSNRTAEVRRLSAFEKGWIAGLIDGEGTLTVHRGIGVHPRLIIGNTSLELVERIKKVIGAGHISKNVKKQSGHHRPCWVYELSARPLGPLLEQVGHHLIIKREHAGILLRVIGINKQFAGGKSKFKDDISRIELQRCSDRLRLINTKGKSIS